jgi:hypothetical protein
MTVGRGAKLDTATPPLHLVAHGEVAVNGAAETPARSGPHRPRTEAPSPAPSTARSSLVSHQATIARLEADAVRAAKPVARLLDQLAAATADLQKAETELAASDAQRANALARAAREGTDAPVLPAADTGAEVVASRARVMNTLRLALDECRQDQQRAAAALEAAKGLFAALVLAVALAEHEALLKIWHARRDLLFDVEEQVLGLETAIGERARQLQSETGNLSWLQRLEGIRQPWKSVPHREIGPREVNVAANRWLAVLTALRSDPDVCFES